MIFTKRGSSIMLHFLQHWHDGRAKDGEIWMSLGVSRPVVGVERVVGGHGDPIGGAQLGSYVSEFSYAFSESGGREDCGRNTRRRAPGIRSLVTRLSIVWCDVDDLTDGALHSWPTG
ncbi:MAG: hypothetical protein A2V70_18855 [Planctomycetes bacterium RBG_13_63_9]|nr:MAG: hypothetical protein A2V70_18855 [Planctomycetes bacterium RBG_13_63_9]